MWYTSVADALTVGQARAIKTGKELWVFWDDEMGYTVSTEEEALTFFGGEDPIFYISPDPSTPCSLCHRGDGPGWK